MVDRSALLVRLVRFERPLGPVLEQLSKFGWDSEKELVEVSASDIADALNAYLDGSASSEEIEEWANALECREDLKINERVGEALHVLANPYITQPLTREAATNLLESMNNAS